MEDLTGFAVCSWTIDSGACVPSVAALLAAHGAGAVALATCQRAEVYHEGGCNCGAPSQSTGIAALQHLAEVAAGLHSVVLGEEQVLGQVRDAWSEAAGAFGATGAAAIGAARRLRERHDLRADTGWLLDRALARAGVSAGGRILVIGTGVLGRRVTARAHELGFSEVAIAGRSIPPGLPPATAWIELPAVRDHGPVDVVVTCLGDGAPRLDPAVDLAIATCLVIDLGTPCNVSGPANVPVVAIADLMDCASPDADPRRAALRAELHEILDERLRPALGKASKPIGQLRGHVESLRQVEAARIRRLHPEVDPNTIDLITRALVNRIFHSPSERLRDLDDPQLGASVAALFAPEEVR